MAREIEPLRRPIDPFRPGQTVGDRDAHVGAAELRNERAVAEFDQPVHDRLRMDQDVDLGGRQREKVVCLDHF